MNVSVVEVVEVSGGTVVEVVVPGSGSPNNMFQATSGQPYVESGRVYVGRDFPPAGTFTNGSVFYRIVAGQAGFTTHFAINGSWVTGGV